MFSVAAGDFVGQASFDRDLAGWIRPQTGLARAPKEKFVHGFTRDAGLLYQRFDHMRAELGRGGVLEGTKEFADRGAPRVGDKDFPHGDSERMVVERQEGGGCGEAGGLSSGATQELSN